MPDDQQKAESLGIRETIQTRNCGKIGRGAERIFQSCLRECKSRGNEPC